MNYKQLQISNQEAEQIVKRFYNINGKATALPGELDFNFQVQSDSKKYILKISRSNADLQFLDFQQQILNHVANSARVEHSPIIINDINGNPNNTVTDEFGNKRIVRLLSFIDGRLWSEINPVNTNLLYNLGKHAGDITAALQGFDHANAQRELEWDLLQASWTFDYLDLFNKNQKKIIGFFQSRYKHVLPELKHLRKSVVHNDVNDNNIIICNDLLNPKVKSIIDYGDAVYTAIVNDVAITVAYAIMDKPDPMLAALAVVKGYHSAFAITEDELKLLYILIAMRLIISITKSAINKKKEPQNKYLSISEKPAWALLEKWHNTNERLACYGFREACGYSAHPNEEPFFKWTQAQKFKITDLFPSVTIQSVLPLDLSVSSRWLGDKEDINNIELSLYKLKMLQSNDPQKIIAGGYLENRSLYDTLSFKKEGNNGPEYRTIHLGIDFWVGANTPINALFDGTVCSFYNNNQNKDYGPTLILEHKIEKDLSFYTLYGHLSESSLAIHKTGQSVKKGDLIGYIGQPDENGSWTPHLHFQIILDLLDNKENFPGVSSADEINIWKSICPDPNLLFKEEELKLHASEPAENLLDYRKQHLGKGLSLSYNNPLKIVRGNGVYLIDSTGRKYLDTVNNVAHVGHEHPRVVKAGQQQIAVLNTNTRYLHDNINIFAKELLATFPKELSVVHFVNSGSEANELALRMAKTSTEQKDFIAVEGGYHGNTSGCIDVSSYKFNGKGGKGAPANTHVVPLPDAFRGKYRGNNTGSRYAAHIKAQIQNVQSKNRSIAGFICESIISCGGQIDLPANYLKEAYSMVHEAGGLCIADEVQVGCGRSGSAFWGFQLHDVIPDIVTIGKPIGNGHPLAAVVCTREVADSFANGMEYFNTFGGNPVSCAIGLEVLKVIKEERLQENALLVGGYLKNELKALSNKFPVLADIRGQGLFLGIELVNKKMQPLADKASYLVNRMKEHAILMSIDGPDNNILKIKPPLVFSKENADELISRLKIILSENYMLEY